MAESIEARPSPIPAVTRRWALAVIGALGLFTAAAVGVWLFRLTIASRPAATAIPLTSYPGQELQPSFSPDGSKVAFSWDGGREDNFDIYVKQIGRDEPLRLTTNPSADFSPAWSPDGRTIAFGRLLSRTQSGIFLIPALGGPERKLAENTAPKIYRSRPFVAWSPDGKWLAYSDADAEAGADTPTGSIPVSLFLISIETGEKRRLTSRPPNSDAMPALHSLPTDTPSPS